MSRTHDFAEPFSTLESRILLSDDHADLPDFGAATPIEFVSREAGANMTYFTPVEVFNGVIEEPGDTDIFTFLAPGDAPVSAMAIHQRDLGVLAPALELRAGDGSLVASHDGVCGVAFVIPSFSLVAGERYYLVARSDAPSGEWETSDTGRYALFVAMDVPLGIDGGGGGEGDGGGGDGSGDGGGDYAPDDYGGRNDEPHPLFSDPFDADAAIGAGLQNPSDSDAFSFRAPGSGPVRVQVLSGSDELTAAITVLDGTRAPRAISTSALPGSKATVEFNAAEGETFTIVVDSPDGRIGDYRLEIDASPKLYHYYYPAGYSSPTIEEFVPMVNPNEFAVTYAVYAHYEFGEKVDLLDAGIMQPHSRGGITVTSRRNPGFSLTREGVPYAFEIVSNGPIGANLGHYDFGATTGESFTDELSDRWEFPEVRRAAGMRDFLVYYNPHPQPVRLRFTLLDEQGVMHRFTRSLDGERRGGINFSNDAAVPRDGSYAVWVESDLPIVAAHTTYDVARGRGDGQLGQPNGGGRAGALAAVSTETGSESRIAILNSSGAAAVLQFRSPQLAGPIGLEVGPRSRVTLSPEDLGLPAGVIATLIYTSTAPVTVSAIQYRHGDGDASVAATEAATSSLIGAAWVNPLARGTYLERLTVVNPGREAAEVTITFLFTDGTSEASTLRLARGDATVIAVDEHEAIVRRQAPTAFSIRVESSAPVITDFTHYDLYLQGGWGSLAAPLGLTVPIEALMR